MNALRYFFTFLCFLWSLSTFATSLTVKDVHPVMKELFEYHIEHKEMNPLLIERSLKIYLHQFDSSCCYLLSREASPYEHPTQEMLSNVFLNYQHGSFTTYFILNDLIQKSIVRAREWRRSWLQTPDRLVLEAQRLNLSEIKQHEQFANSHEELKQRHYLRFLAFIALQMKELGESFEQLQAEKIVALCEKQMIRLENVYLGFDENGGGFTKEMLEHQVILKTLKALASSLDAHTSFYSPDEAYAMKVQLERGMCGVGVVLKEGVDGVVIHDIVKGGPAQKSGKLLVGDTIVEVDGHSVKEFSFHKILEVMRGKEGSKTILGIQRPKINAPEFLRVELVREKITLDDKRVDISAEPFGDGILGKITLHSFYEGEKGINSEQDIKQAINELKKQGTLYGLVLDLRENTGGFLSQAVRVGGLFISSGVVVIAKYSDGSMKYYRTADGERFYDGPLVVLISRNSASAAEIVAQSLQDYGVAIVVGDEQTYGKGTIQHQTVTTDHSPSNFKVTIGRYYTVSGKSTQIDGVKADILVPTSYQYENIGEKFAEYPLPSDTVPPAYQDTLEDIDPHAKKWFQRYYAATLQPKQETWAKYLPLLKANCYRRIEYNKNYQTFLQTLQKDPLIKEAGFGKNDLQLEESINILKDMILIENKLSK